MADHTKSQAPEKGEFASMPPLAGTEIVKLRRRIDWRRTSFILLGIALFALVYFAPEFSPAVDPEGQAFALTPKGQAALALFLFTAAWWVTEVIPIGVTSLLIGVIQTVFLLRAPEDTMAVKQAVSVSAKTAFGDFMDPSVCFIFGSIVIGLAFTKTGLAKRMAYKMLVIVGERTSMIYLGTFVMTAGLTLIMAHTAVAATLFPLLMAIYALYDDEEKPTKFGKGLFIGMAFTAGAGSIITLLGAARGAVGIGFFSDIVGREISFFKLSYFMFPLGMAMVLLLWVFFVVFFKPERATIPGLRGRAKMLYESLGRMKRVEIMTLVIVFTAIILMSLQSFVGALAILHKSAVILVTTVLFFVFKILDRDDLESVPWNIILLFGGAMSIGFCLWETGAARWLAVKWLVMFQTAPKFVFIMAITFLVLMMTNLIMNVAAIAITLPVALVLAGYLGVAPEVILYTSLAAAGMPFLLLVGAAPNAIAYGSGQFKSGEFFAAGIPASILLMAVIALFVWIVWPLMGMPIYT